MPRLNIFTIALQRYCKKTIIFGKFGKNLFCV